LGEGNVANPLSVDARTRHTARHVIDRMLSLRKYRFCSTVNSLRRGWDAFVPGPRNPPNGYMLADEDDDQEQDETPEPPQRLFTLTEAERARQELEPFLVEAMDSRKKLSGLENELAAVSARIMMMGGVIVPYEKLAAVRMEHQQLAETLKTALNRILETGCLVKDLD